MDGLGLDGKAAIVTGSTQGIGRAIAVALAQAGASVTVVGRRAEFLEEAVAELESIGSGVIGVQGDVRNPEVVSRLVSETMSAFGRLDVLVNNTGASYSDTFQRAPLMELELGDLQGAMELNVGTAFMCSKAVAPVMSEHGGSIVNVASIVASHPLTGFGFYSPAKAALVNLTQLMANEWAPQIRVNAVLPGHIDTPRSSSMRTPKVVRALLRGVAMGRLGTPQDVAGAAVYLASDLAQWTTGTAIDVNGGLRAL